MGLNEFFYNGKSTRDFGIYCSGADTYAAPMRKYTAIEIKGKNGLILEDEKAFSNAALGYKCIIMGDIDNYERFKAFMASQSGYKRLEDTFHPDEYREAVMAESISPAIKGDYDVASFEVVFSAKPQRFLKDGERALSFSGSGNILMNNTLFDAKPMIRLLGSGTVTINSTSFTVTDVSGYVDVDCEEMDVYKGSTNMNNKFTGSFPVLTSGLNTISSTVAIEIKPRWYTI